MDLAARVTSGTLHGTAVALDRGRGVLILGPSGAGKSGLALRLMAYGAHLVADDRVILCERDGALIARAPDTIRGRIEARGIGVLTAEALDFARITLVTDLGQPSPERVPTPRHASFGGIVLPLISAVQHDYFAAALLNMLKTGDTP